MTNYDRANPFSAKLLFRERLSGRSSSKETWHVVLDLSGSGITYRPGDSFGICPENDPLLCEKILQSCQFSGDEEVVDERSKQLFRLRDWLKKKANLVTCSRKFLQLLSLPPELLENDEAYKEFLGKWTVPEVIANYSHVPLKPVDLVQTLSPLLPRLYSIASSQSQHPNEVHLTVSYVRYEVEGRERFGVCSHFLCDIATEQKTEVPVYLQPTKDFLLPEDPHTPIIMVGPGTGVAPFRAFMQERAKAQPAGHNWLFFGERQQAHDFLYEDFWQELVKSGHLRLDTAFSRDQPQKVYVQDRLWENRKELWRKIEAGAKIYVCGDASRMAKDVDSCLQQVIAEQATISSEEARNLLTSLRREKRYLRDVY